MDALAYIAARQLKQIVFVEFLENAALQFDEIVWHHNPQQPFVVRIDGHIECGRLEHDQSAVQNDIKQGEHDVPQNAQTIATAIFWFGGRPEEGINGVLAERGQQTIAHLQHIVENVQFDHRLTLDDVVHAIGVNQCDEHNGRNPNRTF